jgi:MerR family copper efflux transcriptional regulator
MFIRELSKRTGVSVHTIRFYEKSGLIKGYRDDKIESNNYFHYHEESVEKLLLIKDAKSIGFTIREIAQLIDAWFNNEITVNDKVAVLDQKLLTINDRIRQLNEMKKMIIQFKKDVVEENCSTGNVSSE